MEAIGQWGCRGGRWVASSSLCPPGLMEEGTGASTFKKPSPSVGLTSILGLHLTCLPLPWKHR